MDQKLIAVLLDTKKKYHKNKEQVTKLLGSDIGILYVNLLDSYYNHIHNDSLSITFSDVAEYTKLAKLYPKNQSEIQAFSVELDAVQRDAYDLSTLLELAIDREYGTQMMMVSSYISDGDTHYGLEDVIELVDKWRDSRTKLGLSCPGEEDDSAGSVYEDPDLAEVFAISPSVSGLRWTMDCLNNALGPITSELILVGARPDSGKTTFLVDQAIHMLSQLTADKRALWFGNEEAIEKVLMRAVVRYFQMPEHDVRSDLGRLAVKWRDEVGKRFTIVDVRDKTIEDVAKILDRHREECGLIVVDQLPKLELPSHTSKGMNEAEKLREIAATARNWAATIAPVLGSVWADGSAEGLDYINMSQLYGSKTGLQGEADAIVTIGRSDPTSDTRYIFIPKNKLSAPEESVRNGRFQVTINGPLCRFEE